MTTYQVIGQSIGRVDGAEKVTGTAQFTADVPLPGILWGKVLRSTYPHARIVRIDASRAKRVPGVVTVLTGADVQGVRYGRRVRDVPVLAEDRVRFVGEKVAAVAAVDDGAAQRALDLIDVEYEELPAVVDSLAALEENAPLLHPDVNSYAGLAAPLETPSNAFFRHVMSNGDLEAGFAQADLIVEGTYTTPRVHQAYLETHTCLVWVDGDGRVQIWASCKAPFQIRKILSTAVGIPEERIRLNHAHIGGDFGGKGDPMDVPLCYYLALHSGRPVRMVMDYGEEFLAANPRHPSVFRMKTGVKRDGTLTAHRVEAIFNSGAYAGFKPLGHLHGSDKAVGPYKIPNAWMEEVQVYTNTVPGGHMRAPGEPQAIFAIESHMDAVARRLGMDPLAFRLQNLMGEGDTGPLGASYQDLRGRETLRAAADAGRYASPKAAHVGRGVAISERGPGGGESNAQVDLNADGANDIIVTLDRSVLSGLTNDALVWLRNTRRAP